jgi:hypothetical protein
MWLILALNHDGFTFGNSIGREENTLNKRGTTVSSTWKAIRFPPPHVCSLRHDVHSRENSYGEKVRRAYHDSVFKEAR